MGHRPLQGARLHYSLVTNEDSLDEIDYSENDGESFEGDADETTNCTEINLIGRYHITSRLRIDVSNFPCVNQLVANQPNREIQPLADDDVCTTRLRRIAVFIVAMTLFLDLSLMTALVPIAPAYLKINSNFTVGYSKLGLLFGSNAAVQVVTNILLGTIIDRHGAVPSLFLGLLVMMTSTTGDISWEHRYEILLAARMLQGVSSACAATGGMAWLASLYHTDEERGQAMGTAMTGLGLGVLVGPPLGSSFTFLGVKDGWKYPFLILAILCLLDGGLQAYVYCVAKRCQDSRMVKNTKKQECLTGDSLGNRDARWISTVVQLSTDPYVVFLFAVSLTGNGIVATLESSFPSVVTEIFNPPGWLLGAIFIPCMLPYILSTPLSGKYLGRLGRHWGLLIGLLCLSLGISVIALCTSSLAHSSPWYLSFPLAFCGIGLGVLDSSVMPYMADIVQKRHSELFGSACAIVDTSVSLAFFLGPVVSNYLIDVIQYEWVYIILGILSLLMAPFTVLLQLGLRNR